MTLRLHKDFPRIPSGCLENRSLSRTTRLGLWPPWRAAEDELMSLVQHYRDRADCENYFDEIKNQWGWGGFTTKDIKSSRLMARIIALVYNWWTLFVRMINPSNHLEAITSRPLLLSSVGRLTETGRQKKLLITSQHNKAAKVRLALNKLSVFFEELKRNAPQLSPREIWCRLLEKSMAAFGDIFKRKKLLPLARPG